ncbi:hypothetical protein ACFP2T_13440 [Plantactinospora solaniradicis]|uniref:Holin n=1 Tax=Plantactinospora solaniradicis TaxID=1723736 RepID=A0ABW1K7H3_9ACTN
MKVAKYAKTIVAAIVAGGTALAVAMGDDTLSTTEGVTIALAVLGALGVYVVPNARDTDV